MRLKTFSIALMVLISFRVVLAQNTTPTIKTTQIGENLHQFYIYINSNNSVNIFLLEGEKGLLLIDAGYTNTTDLLKGEIAKISNKPIQYVINTHVDGDHTGGNAVLGEGATIIAHQKCLEQLKGDTRTTRDAYPNLTFNDSLSFKFGDETIGLKYMPGHTNTDVVVYLTNHKMIFVGDLILSDSFFLAHTTGDVSNLEKNIRRFLSLIPADYKILVSHGSEIKPEELHTYLDMFIKTKAIVIDAINKGKSPEQAKKEDILKDWKSWNSKIFPRVNADRWIEIVYALSEEGKAHSAFQKIKTVYEKSGLAEARLVFEELRKGKKPNFFFNENEFNNWGYAVLGSGKYADAIEIFQMNTVCYPESANAFDSLAEAYMNAGNKELAIKNYEKSLELNPQNTNATEQINKLKN